MQIDLTKDALSDLADIQRYTALNWGLRQAQRYENKLKKCFEAVAKNPKRAVMRDGIPRKLKAFMCQKHVLIFDATDKKVSIVRILHQAMDPRLHLDNGVA
ncbi:MAG: type II toxin-antitoxin system RelE/ParE family toxin [Alphaproteobacteria bacterium]|jgi:toxin ParE1/3/4|nr:type II toxin-antitoxin system RelE/ParE family toxin [Thalassospira sp.]MCE2964557.1 type II toxin-antitoxin system RelE/ParE family toxin [Alphaproteobacteria bacterium]